MELATLTSQNQITIPAKVRKALKLKPGDKVSFYNQGKDTLKFGKALTLKDSHGILKEYAKNARKNVTADDLWVEGYDNEKSSN